MRICVRSLLCTYSADSESMAGKSIAKTILGGGGGRCIDSLTPEAHPPMGEKYYCLIEESIERMSSI